MSKLVNILEGWGKYITGKIPQYALGRAEICGKCEDAEESKFEMFMKDDSLREIEGLVCNLCSCPIVAKIRAKEETCPKRKWQNPKPNIQHPKMSELETIIQENGDCFQRFVKLGLIDPRWSRDLYIFRDYKELRTKKDLAKESIYYMLEIKYEVSRNTVRRAIESFA